MKYKTFILALSIIFFVGCNDIKETNHSIETDIELSKDGNDVQEAAKLEDNCLLESIEIIETDDEVNIFVTPIDGTSFYWDTFEIAYDPNYSELILKNMYQGIPEGYKLINSDKVSNVEESKFIKRWYKTITFGDHYDQWNVMFHHPIEYTIEELQHPLQYKINIKQIENSTPTRYHVRTQSTSFSDAGIMLEDLSYLTRNYSNDDINYSVHQDNEGFFCHLASFEAENEAEDFSSQISDILKENDSYLSIVLEVIKRNN